MELRTSGTTTAGLLWSLGLSWARGRPVSERRRAAAGSQPIVADPGRNPTALASTPRQRWSSGSTSRRRRPHQLRLALAQAQLPDVRPGQAALKTTSDQPKPRGIARRPTTKARSLKPDKDDSQLRRFHPSGTSRSSSRRVPQPPFPQLVLRPVRHRPATLETVPVTPLAPKPLGSSTSSSMTTGLSISRGEMQR